MLQITESDNQVTAQRGEQASGQRLDGGPGRNGGNGATRATLLPAAWSDVAGDTEAGAAVLGDGFDRTGRRNTKKVILLIESSRASGRELLKGIARYSHHYGPWSFYWEPGGLERVGPKLKSMDADGIIFRDVGRLTAQVRRLGIPAVVVGHRDKEVRGLINVVTDSATIGRMAAEHLLHCGFRHFAFCGLASARQEQTPWSQGRSESFHKQIVEAGYAAPPTFVLPSPGADWQQNRRRLAGWLAGLPRPVGIMACNDDCGVQVIGACLLAGLAVPDDVGIVGVDNDEALCGLSDPPMTSVAVNFEQAGHQAAEALGKLMSRGKPDSPTIQVWATHLVARRSTDVVAVEDQCVARALRFMRDNAGRPFSVDEVARETGVSRRALERRFRREMGSSILHEIRRVRSDRIARLLVETDWPVNQIAQSLGFADVQHFARYFRAAKNLSPLAFRKSHSRQPGRRLSQNGGLFPQSGVVG